MTYAEMQSRLDLFMDKAGAPWFTSAEKDVYLNDALLEFVEKQYDMFEKDERAREALHPLVRKSSAFTATSKINLDSLPSYLYVLNLDVTFTDPQTNGTMSPWLPPRKLDKESRNKVNSFNKPTDKYPVYIQYHDGTNRVLEIQSSTTPLTAYVYYLKTPAVINTVSTPTSTVELPVNTHRKICNIAIREMLENIESPRLQTIMGELAEED